MIQLFEIVYKNVYKNVAFRLTGEFIIISYLSLRKASPSGFCGALRSGFLLWPLGRGNPSTASLNRTTKFASATSASGCVVIAFITASAISFRTLALRQVFGNQVIWTNGIVSDMFLNFVFDWSSKDLDAIGTFSSNRRMEKIVFVRFLPLGSTMIVDTGSLEASTSKLHGCSSNR